MIFLHCTVFRWFLKFLDAFLSKPKSLNFLTLSLLHNRKLYYSADQFSTSESRLLVFFSRFIDKVRFASEKPPSLDYLCFILPHQSLSLTSSAFTHGHGLPHIFSANEIARAHILFSHSFALLNSFQDFASLSKYSVLNCGPCSYFLSPFEISQLFQATSLRIPSQVFISK